MTFLTLEQILLSGAIQRYTWNHNIRNKFGFHALGANYNQAYFLQPNGSYYEITLSSLKVSWMKQGLPKEGSSTRLYLSK